MPSGDSNAANNQGAGPDSNPDAEAPRAPSSGADEKVDFGSYVSNTVRSSADLFGTPPRSSSSRNRRTTGQSPPADQPEIDPGQAAPGTPQPRTGGTSGPKAAAGSNRPRTYWRDSLSAPATSGPEDAARDEPGADGGRRRFGGMPAWSVPDDGRTRGIIIAVIALAILGLIALVWFLNRGAGDDVSPPPTGTIESVIDAPGTPIESEGDVSTPSGFIPFEDEETPEPEATEAVRRGGDNQLDRNDPGTP